MLPMFKCSISNYVKFHKNHKTMFIQISLFFYLVITIFTQMNFLKCQIIVDAIRWHAWRTFFFILYSNISIECALAATSIYLVKTCWLDRKRGYFDNLSITPLVSSNSSGYATAHIQILKTHLIGCLAVWYYNVPTDPTNTPLMHFSISSLDKLLNSFIHHIK
jgi:hypothetical protein